MFWSLPMKPTNSAPISRDVPPCRGRWLGRKELVATGWSAVDEEWGATQLQDRFRKQAGRWMLPSDYAAWLAVKSVGEAATRLHSLDPAAIAKYLRSDDFLLAGFKGQGLSFRPWDGRDAPAHSDRGPPAARFQFAATGFSASAHAARHSGHRPGGKHMQTLIALVLVLILVPPAVAETIYVSNEQDNTVAVVDRATMTLQSAIEVGRRPRGMALSVDKKTLFVAEGDDNRIDVVDLAKRQVVGQLPSGADPEFFVVHPDGKRLFVANENDNLVSVVDIAGAKIIGTVDVGVEPEGMAVSADGRTVACIVGDDEHGPSHRRRHA
ncbi:hypothetical protein ACVOMV_19745 [Mesorhizobium atlanticum]